MLVLLQVVEMVQMDLIQYGDVIQLLVVVAVEVLLPLIFELVLMVDQEVAELVAVEITLDVVVIQLNPMLQVFQVQQKQMMVEQEMVDLYQELHVPVEQVVVEVVHLL